MAKHIQISIDEPCHENWDEMSTTEKGRFCASCQKQVLDFSGMSDSQVAAFFKKPSNGSVCGRFHNDQLNRDIEIPKKRIPWVRYFFQILLPAFLASKAQAQDKNKPTKQDSLIKHVVVTPIKQKSEKRHREDTLPALLSPALPDLSKLENLPINIEKKPKKINCVSELTGRMGGITVTGVEIGGYRRKRNKKSSSINTIPLIQHKLMDTALRFFRIFPNQVSSGASLHIEWKKVEEGYYKIELIDASGKIVHSREVWIDAEAQVMNMEIPSVTPGVYYLRVTNKESGKGSTEILSIQ
jgi:hypothetical protein